MTAHNTKSQKAKGRRLQQHVRYMLIRELGIDPKDILSTPMGQAGPDIYLATNARTKFPYAVECKNVERLDLWGSLKQCEMNARKDNLTPLLVVHRNNSKTYVVVELDEFLKILRRSNNGYKK